MDSLFTFVMAIVALMVVPGPDMAYCIASGLSYGKRGAWFAALELGLLLCVIGTAMNVGFGLAGSTAKSLNRVVFLHRSLAQIVLALVFFVIALVFLVDIARSV